MARARIVKQVFEKIDPVLLKKQAHEEKVRQKQLENQLKQREEAEQRRREKEEQCIAERKQLLAASIQEALEKGEITAEEAMWLPELNTDHVVTWTHFPYIDKMTNLRQQMDNGEWEEVCMYLTDKKDYNPAFTQYVKTLFPDSYSFEEHQPHANPYMEWKKNHKHDENGRRHPVENEINREPWADNLFDACAPHLLVTTNSAENNSQFGLMTVWRRRFTKHGLSMMGRSQFIKSKLFEQETDIPVFMIIGLGGTDQMPDQLFVVPFTDIVNHFIPKPIAYRYEVDPHIQLHYIPELRKLK